MTIVRTNGYGQPTLEVPCRGGALVAEHFGAPADDGEYDGIVVFFRRATDGGEVQCSLTEMKPGADGGTDLRVATFNQFEDDDETFSEIINQDSEFAVFPPEAKADAGAFQELGKGDPATVNLTVQVVYSRAVEVPEAGTFEDACDWLAENWDDLGLVDDDTYFSVVAVCDEDNREHVVYSGTGE